MDQNENIDALIVDQHQKPILSMTHELRGAVVVEVRPGGSYLVQMPDGWSGFEAQKILQLFKQIGANAVIIGHDVKVFETEAGN